MSCIAGIMNLDGEPVDRLLLESMTSAMARRAPDGMQTWVSGNIGLGHASLALSPQDPPENHPCTLDGKVWITADARVDGRTELIRQLRSAGSAVEMKASDANLILHAYHAFGQSFLQHLIGDFAFALWDGHTSELICARDQFGIRPFFYAKKAHCLLFASDMAALLAHPALTRNLDETFIADFLMIGCATEAATSVYTDIRRLPPAGLLTVHRGKCQSREYWKLPINNEVRFKNDSDYVEHFRELFYEAVSDRVRANRVAVQMSGGLDSTSVAAAAVNNCANHGVTAHTITCQGLFPKDEEGHFARTVSSHLAIPGYYQAIEDYDLFEQFDSPNLRTSEPFANPHLIVHYEKLSLMATTGTRILLTGHGGDALFSGTNFYYRNLLYSGQFTKLIKEMLRHLRYTGTLAGMGLRSAILPRSKRPLDWQPAFPAWISREFAERNDLQERWNTWWHEWGELAGAERQLSASWLSQVLASYELLYMPVMFRHPFYDLRLAGFLLGLPNYITNDKNVLRQAMRETLPGAVTSRPKALSVGDALRAKLTSKDYWPRFRTNLEVVSNCYIDKKLYLAGFENYLKGEGIESVWSSQMIVRPVALNYWLKYSCSS